MCWGVGGTALLLLEAIVRLTPITVSALQDPRFHVGHLLVLLLWVVANTYYEGYRGFHRSFSPRCVATAIRLAREGSTLSRVLAPLVCLGLVYVPRRRLIASWGLVTGIVAMVFAVRMLPQPWRGIVDAGVVSALIVGLISIGWFVLVAAREGLSTDAVVVTSTRSTDNAAAVRTPTSRNFDDAPDGRTFPTVVTPEPFLANESAG